MFEIILFPLYIELDFVLHIWLGEVPEGVLLLTKMNLILSLVSLTSSGLVSFINANGNIKLFKVSMGIIFIMSLPIAYFLFMMGAPYYVILILLIVADIVYRIVQFVLLKKIMNYDVLQYIKEAYTRPFIIFIIMTLIIIIYNYIGGGDNSIIKLCNIVLCGMITTFLVLIFGLTKEERRKIISTIKNKL